MNPILGNLLVDLLMGLSELFVILGKAHMALSLFCLRLVKVVNEHIKKEAN